MDRKQNRMHSHQLKINFGQRSAFEMSLSLENQDPESQIDPPSSEVSNLKAGELCPNCQSAKIDYDGMLNLSCPNCSYTLGGCFT